MSSSANKINNSLGDSPILETNLLQRQAKWLDSYQPHLRIQEQGAVVSVGDGIAWIVGLPSAAMDDVLLFADGSRGMVFDLNENMIGAILLLETETLTSGTTVQRRDIPSVCRWVMHCSAGQ